MILEHDHNPGLAFLFYNTPRRCMRTRVMEPPKGVKFGCIKGWWGAHKILVPMIPRSMEIFEIIEYNKIFQHVLSLDLIV